MTKRQPSRNQYIKHLNRSHNARNFSKETKYLAGALGLTGTSIGIGIGIDGHKKIKEYNESRRDLAIYKINGASSRVIKPLELRVRELRGQQDYANLGATIAPLSILATFAFLGISRYFSHRAKKEKDLAALALETMRPTNQMSYNGIEIIPLAERVSRESVIKYLRQVAKAQEKIEKEKFKRKKKKIKIKELYERIREQFEKKPTGSTTIALGTD